jgi:hypothetical protein
MLRFKVLGGEYEGYCLQGTREDADRTSKLSQYMHHTKEQSSVPQKVCAFQI